MKKRFVEKLGLILSSNNLRNIGQTHPRRNKAINPFNSLWHRFQEIRILLHIKQQIITLFIQDGTRCNNL